MAGSKLEGIQDKVNEYLDRVQALHNACKFNWLTAIKNYPLFHFTFPAFSWCSLPEWRKHSLEVQFEEHLDRSGPTVEIKPAQIFTEFYSTFLETDMMFC